MLTEPILWFFAAVIYLSLMWLFLRSNQLVGIYKWLFSLAVVPVFIALMVANIWIADHAFPHILEWHQAEWYRLWIKDWKFLDGYLARRAQGLVVFLITSLIPVAVCWLWYVVFVRLSHRRNRV